MEQEDYGMEDDPNVQDMGAMMDDENMDGEPALMVVDKGDDRQSRAEKKMRKQIRDKMVHKDHA